MKLLNIVLLCLLISNTDILCQGNIIAKNTLPSVVLLSMEDENGQLLSLGSGFFVANNIVATNYHVIDGSSRGYAKIVNSNRKILINGVLAYDKDRDIVLLSISSDAFPLKLGDFDKVEVGDDIFAVGNPKGLEGTFSKGVVSSIRSEGMPPIDSKMLQITAPISPGSSGGPVLNSKGEVIGISVATIKDGQNLNFAIPIFYLKNILKQKNNMVSIKSISSSSGKKDNHGDKLVTAVVGNNFMFTHCNCSYQFSVVNKTQYDIKNVIIYLIFYNLQGDLYDTKIFNYEEIIPSGLPISIEEHCDMILYKMTIDPDGCNGGDGFGRKPYKMKIRVVDFDIIE